jgi:hypothetical protein
MAEFGGRWISANEQISEVEKALRELRRRPKSPNWSKDIARMEADLMDLLLRHSRGELKEVWEEEGRIPDTHEETPE